MGKVTGAVEQTSTQQLQEKIKINAVSVNSTTKTVKLSVSNIGDTDVTISGAYVLTQGGTSVCSSSSSVDSQRRNSRCHYKQLFSHIGNDIHRKGCYI